MLAPWESVIVTVGVWEPAWEIECDPETASSLVLVPAATEPAEVVPALR